MNKAKYTVVSTLGVGFVILGLCIRFGGEQFLTDYYRKNYNEEPPKSGCSGVKYVGVGFYVVGWLIGAMCLFKRSGSKNAILRNSVFSGILVSLLWAVFEFKDVEFEYRPKMPLIACSVLLSSMVSLIVLKKDLSDIMLIIVASILIVAAEYFILPWQREFSIHDGIGTPMIILGWFILFYVFSETENFQNGYL